MGTGSDSLDMMLDRVDSLEMIAPWDDTEVRGALRSVDSMASRFNGANAMAAGLFVKSHLYEIDENQEAAMDVIRKLWGW